MKSARITSSLRRIWRSSSFEADRFALELHHDVVAFAHIVDFVGQAALAQLLDLADDLRRPEF